MQQRRAGAGATVSNGKIYVAGGFDDNAPLSSVEVYDPKAKMWHNIRQMTSPRGGVGLSPLSGNLVAVGGHNGSEYLRSVEIYSILHDTWIKVPLKIVSYLKNDLLGSGNETSTSRKWNSLDSN